MNTDVAELAGGPVLGGAVAGRGFLERLLLCEERAAHPTPWLWDFHGVDVVSASFIREAFVAARRRLRSQSSKLVPVIVRAGGDVLDDLNHGFAVEHEAILIASLTDGGEIAPRGLDLIGDLDPHLRATFALVAERGETDARELKEASDTQADKAPIVQTAWNNRLARLAEIGALVEIPRGRAKRYRLIF